MSNPETLNLSLERVLSEVAQNMLSIKSLLGHISDSGEFDHTHALIELVANRTGAIADMTLRANGHTVCNGDMADWFGDTRNTAHEQKEA